MSYEGYVGEWVDIIGVKTVSEPKSVSGFVEGDGNIFIDRDTVGIGTHFCHIVDNSSE